MNRHDSAKRKLKYAVGMVLGVIVLGSGGWLTMDNWKADYPVPVITWNDTNKVSPIQYVTMKDDRGE